MEDNRSRGKAAVRAPVFAVVDDAVGPRTLIVSGDIDILSAPSLNEFLDGHVRQAVAQRRTEIDLDLSRVLFFSAAGVHSLLAAVQKARDGGVKIWVRPSSAVALVLDATRTRDRIDVRPAPEQPSPL